MKNSEVKVFSSILLGFAILFLNLSAAAQVRPIYDLGAVGLAQKLKRLQTTASAMHTGAHPDDEDSGLLAYLARREQARTAYLSLNRGEGGQNVIGAELSEPLGVIRSEELLQARRLDGGQQFFTRVLDYGFSKKREEAARFWGEKLILGDMVRAIRLFRPLVVVSRFTGTASDGHGHHQLAGFLTPLAFRAAADPNQFPEQIQEGLQPWQAKKLYVSQSFAANAENVPSLTLNTGEHDLLIGRSYFEIAMEGRSQHKSQEMGSLELRGKQTSGLRLLETNGAKIESEKSVFDGIDISIAGIPKLVGLTDDFLDDRLVNIQKAAAKALNDFDALNPAKTIAPLVEGLREVRKARREIAGKFNRGKTQNLADADFLLAQKEQEFSEALQAAAGVVVDALSNTETIVAGDAGSVAVRVFAPDAAEIKVSSASLRAPQGWTVDAAPQPLPPATPNFRARNETASSAFYFTVSVPPNALPTEPYWLRQPRENFAFDWSKADTEKNMPFQSPLVRAEVKINIGGEEITFSKPVQYRFADDIRGEIRRDLNVIPALTVALDTNLIVAPVSAKAQKQKIAVSVTNHAPREIKGKVALDLPAGWTISPASADFALRQKGERAAINFEITISARAQKNSYKIAAAVLAENQKFNQTMQEIAYPHIQTHRLYTNAEASVKLLDLKVAPVSVGYVKGTGDSVPEAIKRLGVSVSMLEEKDLSTGDLSRFDTIVIGIRAAQSRPDFVANHNRLLDFVKRGGTMIVQYQQPEYVNQNLPPFPAKMDAAVNGSQRVSNVRVVDENAPVKILEPENPVFNFPNKITDADFSGWVQERNLYNFSTFDARYKPLLESHDAGEAESRGGMVYARLGKGIYVYNSYSFFRQLPNGVEGAYRIFANLLSLPKAPKSKRE